ncbi:hypothetical protein P4114_33205 [Pseudomonas aeruginosa]|nr:hypothetical protein [Pseudomonas aeruginosa]
MPYKTLTKGVAMFKHKEDTLEPDDHALLSPLRWAEVVRLGQEGWELVSVQPLMRGVTEIGNQNAQGWAWGIALPVSYLLFFKRATSIKIPRTRAEYFLRNGIRAIGKLIAP